MEHIDTLIIGGGQAGLAMSRCLSDRGIDHVVLERGRVAERWRTERWDSLRMLTPRWQSRLPGFSYRGPDPDGYMTMPELIAYLERYAQHIDAPVRAGTTVHAVEATDGGYRVTTDDGVWRADNVVVATGSCDVPQVPPMASRLSGDVAQWVPSRYRNAAQLPEGGVLVVGASASGVQLADEIHASGRPVTIAVGRHTRLPRRYRGLDILWWLDRARILEETAEQVFDLEASRNQPSLQLVGRPDHRTLDLPALVSHGVKLVGRAVGIDGRHVTFADDLDATTAAADAKLRRLLDRIDRFATRADLDGVLPKAAPIAPFVAERTPTRLDLSAEGIRTVLWATGYRRSYPWLKVPVLDAGGEIRHDHGVTPAPGLYVLGLRFLRTRKSTFLDGVGDDARALAQHIHARSARRQQAA